MSMSQERPVPSYSSSSSSSSTTRSTERRPVQSPAVSRPQTQLSPTGRFVRTTATYQISPCDMNNAPGRDRPSTSSSAPAPRDPVFYDQASRTYYPSKPIRAITPSYTTVAAQTPVTLKEPRKLLVILDLNGTLFYRNKANRRSVTARPHLSTFLDFLFEHCRVMVWSSAQPHSVEAMLSFGFGDRVSRLDRVWSRDHFRLPQVDYARKVLTIKDLEYVWEGIEKEKKAQREGEKHPKYAVQFDQTNTVLIDDSKHKTQLQPHNGLALRDFDEDLARAGTDSELLKVRAYLAKLVYQENVSAYMRLHPFDSDAPLEKTSVKKAKATTATGEAALGDELDELTRRLEKSTI
ncbi:hypothetical protein BGZ70_003249 [Mortierella alpina]|uniref:Mitochondrial import inner membrane translocase subunit TIM50 n=1 Tax=Mortierella alpina TaxID=64518 RepID=A0A9P6JAG8_MORAP|nr:hypothetical protein BGZ70_003249 [Mortierella alpina]